MAPTQYESADLILKLYDLRRETKLREARDWWMKFKPKSAQDLKSAAEGEDKVRLMMPLGYWEMAAALVNHGAIDEEMFNDTNFEHVIAFAKIQPYLKEARTVDPWFFEHVEKLVMRQPNAQEMLDGLRKQFA